MLGLTERDVALARQISVAARDLGVRADPAAVQDVQLAVDALVGPDVMPFWRAVLGYEQVGDEDLLDPHASGPAFWFQEMDALRGFSGALANPLPIRRLGGIHSAGVVLVRPLSVAGLLVGVPGWAAGPIGQEWQARFSSAAG